VEPTLSKPALARVYNGAAGGTSTAAVDRSLLERVFALMPGYKYFAMANQRFAAQAVAEFVDAGLTQILDLGCGMLTPQSSHQVAHAKNADVRIVYVDSDPVTVEHVRNGTAGDDRIGVVQADVRHVDQVLDAAAAVLDLDRPVGVLAAAVLHCLPDDDEIHPSAAVRRYHERLAPGSMFAASHATGDTLEPEVVAEAIALFRHAGIVVLSRSADEFNALLEPWHNPGLRRLLWLPNPDAEEIDALAYTAMATRTPS
jgi:SAM-dependent methyltransferase